VICPNETKYLRLFVAISKLYSLDVLYNKETAFCKLSSVWEIINWSSANNSVLKINSLKYLLVSNSRNQIRIAASKCKLNQTGDSGHPCLTPCVKALKYSDIPCPALTLIVFSIYIFCIEVE